LGAKTEIPIKKSAALALALFQVLPLAAWAGDKQTQDKTVYRPHYSRSDKRELKHDYEEKREALAKVAAAYITYSQASIALFSSWPRLFDVQPPPHQSPDDEGWSNSAYFTDLLIGESLPDLVDPLVKASLLMSVPLNQLTDKQKRIRQELEKPLPDYSKWSRTQVEAAAKAHGDALKHGMREFGKLESAEQQNKEKDIKHLSEDDDSKHPEKNDVTLFRLAWENYAISVALARDKLSSRFQLEPELEDFFNRQQKDGKNGPIEMSPRPIAIGETAMLLVSIPIGGAFTDEAVSSPEEVINSHHRKETVLQRHPAIKTTVAVIHRESDKKFTITRYALFQVIPDEYDVDITKVKPGSDASKREETWNSTEGPPLLDFTEISSNYIILSAILGEYKVLWSPSGPSIQEMVHFTSRNSVKPYGPVRKDQFYDQNFLASLKPWESGDPRFKGFLSPDLVAPTQTVAGASPSSPPSSKPAPAVTKPAPPPPPVQTFVVPPPAMPLVPSGPGDEINPNFLGTELNRIGTDGPQRNNFQTSVQWLNLYLRFAIGPTADNLRNAQFNTNGIIQVSVSGSKANEPLIHAAPAGMVAQIPAAHLADAAVIFQDLVKAMEDNLVAQQHPADPDRLRREINTSIGQFLQVYVAAHGIKLPKVLASLGVEGMPDKSLLAAYPDTHNAAAIVNGLDGKIWGLITDTVNSINFAINAAPYLDYMENVALQMAAQSSGADRVQWQQAAAALHEDSVAIGKVKDSLPPQSEVDFFYKTTQSATPGKVPKGHVSEPGSLRIALSREDYAKGPGTMKDTVVAALSSQLGVEFARAVDDFVDLFGNDIAHQDTHLATTARQMNSTGSGSVAVLAQRLRQAGEQTVAVAKARSAQAPAATTAAAAPAPVLRNIQFDFTGDPNVLHKAIVDRYGKAKAPTITTVDLDDQITAISGAMGRINGFINSGGLQANILKTYAPGFIHFLRGDSPVGFPESGGLYVALSEKDDAAAAIVDALAQLAAPHNPALLSGIQNAFSTSKFATPPDDNLSARNRSPVIMIPPSEDEGTAEADH
jgi:hypothetical protein